jgi:hypothetical protein
MSTIYENGYLLLVLCLLSVAGCKKPPINAHKETYKLELIGVWQDSRIIAAGWSNAFRFFQDGRFIFNTNQMDCESRDRTLSGTWKFKPGYLVLDVISEGVVVGGTLVEAQGSCGSDKDIEGGKLIDKSVSLKRVINKSISKIMVDSGVDCFGESYQRPVIQIDGKKYWKFSNDPAEY